MSDDEVATLSDTDCPIKYVPSTVDNVKSDLDLNKRHSVGPDDPSKLIQKRRRVTRACDECRRKKIRCDGKQPCTHCSAYRYGCKYDTISNRRRNPTPQYIEVLEGRLHRAETLLRKYTTDIDLCGPNMDPTIQDGFQNREQLRMQSASKPQNAALVPRPATSDTQLVSMINSIGQLDLDDRGHWSFHGNSSGVVFLKKMRHQFQGLCLTSSSFLLPHADRLAATPDLDSSSMHSSPPFSSISTYPELPPKDVARRLCYYSLTCATCLVRIVHVPSFNDQFERIFKIPPDSLSEEDIQFLSLLFAMFALGNMYCSVDASASSNAGYKATLEQGTKYYRTARSLMKDPGECCSITSIQALLYMILFLQSTSNLSTCYSFIGIALRLSLRIGLHKRLQHAKLNPVEQELRKRVFYAVRQIDVYVSAMLGLPVILHDDDIDQPYPVEVDDEYITSREIVRPPPGTSSFFEAFNAHTRLMDILRKIVKAVYPTKSPNNIKIECVAFGNPVSFNRVKEIEADLHVWFELLPEAWRLSPEGPIEVVRVRHLLRFAYAHVQLVLYRPFLHYLSPRLCQGMEIDELSHKCAAAAITVSRNIVHIGQEMRKQRVLSGPYWFMLYTEYFAILSLIFYVVENPEEAGRAEILAEARAGRQMIAELAEKSMVAELLTTSLTNLFGQLTEAMDQGCGRAIAANKRSTSKDGGMGAGGTEIGQVTSPQRSEDLVQTHSERMSTNSFSMDSMVPSEPSFHEHNFAAGMHGIRSLYMPSRATPYFTPTAASLSHHDFMLHSVATQTCRNPVTILDSLMFPPDDPFAYPSQPIMELGSQPNQDGTLVTMAQDSTLFFPVVLEEMDKWLINPTLTYMEPQGQGKGKGLMSMRGGMYDVSGMVDFQQRQQTHALAAQAQTPQPQTKQQRSRQFGFFHRRVRQERQQEQQIDKGFTEHGIQVDVGNFFGTARAGSQGM